MGIRIINRGLLTTVQDLGRYGYQLLGVSSTGPMDKRSFLIANALVDNEDNSACLEITMMGPTLEVTEDMVIAITGGDLSPVLNNNPIPMYCALNVQKGDIISFRVLKTGCRSYISFAGGLAVPEVLGSKSTFLRGGFGGYEGRALKPNDEIPLCDSIKKLSNMSGRRIKQEDFSDKEVILRVIMGPQDDRFSEKGIQTFLTSPYKVGGVFDRMGYRLEGEKIEHIKDANIASDGISFGSIQVPGNGLPIIMGSDRQTTGGYTKIANVVSCDLPILGQRKAGDTIRFKKISIHEAQDLYMEERENLLQLKKEISNDVMKRVNPVSFYTIRVNGKSYDVKVQEI